MARLASTQVGGYYKTPTNLLKRIAAPLFSDPISTYPNLSVLDPCAGDGEAVEAIAHAVKGKSCVNIYAIELEKTRFLAMKERFKMASAHIAHGDAFCLPSTVMMDKGYRKYFGASLLYANPPYDTHSVHGRLEQAFLERYTQFVIKNGVLVFVVPRTSLAASANHLATYFEEFSVYAFPEEEYKAFKQVVLYARRRSIPFSAPDMRVVNRLHAIADGAEIAVLPEEGQTFAKNYSLPCEDSGFNEFSLAAIDEVALSASYKLWTGTNKGKTAPLKGFGLELNTDNLYYQSYPVAQPLRPGHVAQALAAGIFNGREITPNKGSEHLPALYVKGNFKREFVTIESHTKENGDPSKDVQVEVPRLEVVALDTTTGAYVTLASGTEPTNAKTLDKMNVADLVVSYSAALLDVLEAQCPPLQKTGDTSLFLPELSRPLYPAQADCARASLKLLQQGQNPFILGEIGSGKTSVAAQLLEALAHGVEGLSTIKNALVVCPPHLLDGWKEQLLAILPGAGVKVLDTISDLENLPAPKDPSLPGGKLSISILSRERAKLGHGMVGGLHKHQCSKCKVTETVKDANLYLKDGVQPISFCSGTHTLSCPKCGKRSTLTNEEAVRVRWRCKEKIIRPRNAMARVSMALANVVAAMDPNNADVQGLLGSKAFKMKEAALPYLWERFFVEAGQATHEIYVDAVRAIIVALWVYQGENHDDLLLQTTQLLWKGGESLDKDIAEATCMFDDLSVGEKVRSVQVQRCKNPGDNHYFTEAFKTLRRMNYKGDDNPYNNHYANGFYYLVKNDKGVVAWNGKERGDRSLLFELLSACIKESTWAGSECGEPLYQATADPRRFPIATYISRYAKNLFDAVVLDEVHEAGTNGSAQERAIHRLAELGVPTFFMTGSAMNGYAKSLFRNAWSASPKMREEFLYKESGEFVKRYGYQKRVVYYGDESKKKPETRGAVTDLVQTRTTGDAPGVLPLFLVKHLLPIAATLHKEDVVKDLPKCKEIAVELSEEAQDRDLFSNYKRLQDKLVEKIKESAFTVDNGKLFGAMAELPSYLDRAAVGLGNFGSKEERVWRSQFPDGREVAQFDLIDAELPKERWLKNLLVSEWAEGRNVTIFVWHTGADNGLTQRLTKLVESLGEKAAVLDPAKVPTAKRQEWINKEVLKKERKVLITNPMAVQTGLNNLVHFSTAVWYENPVVNPLVYRQANGRFHRIGQKKEVRVYIPVCVGTVQAAAHTLLMRKVAISLQIDGLDARGALEAAGVGEQANIDALSIGRALYEAVLKERRS